MSTTIRRLSPLLSVDGDLTGPPSHMCTPTHGPRPAGPPDRCFYCGVPVGSEHRRAGDPVPDDEVPPIANVVPEPGRSVNPAHGCVLRRRVVRMHAVIEFAIAVPDDWTPDDVNNRYVDGTWCANNLFDLLRPYDPGADVQPGGGCLCGHAEFHYAGEVILP